MPRASTNETLISHGGGTGRLRTSSVALTHAPGDVRDARRRAPDHVDLLVDVSGATLLLGVAEAFGAWQWLPSALWWAGLPAGLAAL